MSTEKTRKRHDSIDRRHLGLNRVTSPGSQERGGVIMISLCVLGSNPPYTAIASPIVRQLQPDASETSPVGLERWLGWVVVQIIRVISLHIPRLRVISALASPTGVAGFGRCCLGHRLLTEAYLQAFAGAVDGGTHLTSTSGQTTAGPVWYMSMVASTRPILPTNRTCLRRRTRLCGLSWSAGTSP